MKLKINSYRFGFITRIESIDPILEELKHSQHIRQIVENIKKLHTDLLEILAGDKTEKTAISDISVNILNDLTT